MIVIVGASASGKSTLQDEICAKFPQYEKLVTYTSRPRREGEIDGVDYHFRNELYFDQHIDEFLEVNTYNGWSYGTKKCDLKENTVAIMTPSGMRILQKYHEAYRWPINITYFYLDVPRRDRLIASLERGDDVDEAIRRNLSDVGMFDGVYNEVTYTLFNPKYKKSVKELVDEVETLML